MVQVHSPVLLYEDPRFYSAFPCLARAADGSLMLAFRRCPDRRHMALGADNFPPHTDPNSQVVWMRSEDQGVTWSQPALLYAHPLGGMQDPCLLTLRNGTMLCASYLWYYDGFTRRESDAGSRLGRLGDFVYLGGLLLRSRDGGQSWHELDYPPIPGEPLTDIYGRRIKPGNRGALCQLRDGQIAWAVASRAQAAPGSTAVHLLRGNSEADQWSYAGIVATDVRVGFNETSLHESPAGDLIAFLRSDRMDGQAALARRPSGRSDFTPWVSLGFQGEPLQVCPLDERRTLLVYGHRHGGNYGVRARIMDAECQPESLGDEIILCQDGGGLDVGYPWAIPVAPHRVLVAYYHHRGQGPRGIWAQFLDFSD